MAAAGLYALVGCKDAAPQGALGLTQTPVKEHPAEANARLMDARYPAGSRRLLLLPPYQRVSRV